MGELLVVLRLIIETLVLKLGYVGIALLMFVENVFPPIPSEPILVFSGALAAEGKLQLAGVLVSSITGSVAGALMLYGLGNRLGVGFIRRFLRRYGRYILLVERDLEKSLNYFQRYGNRIVLFGRLFPVVRSLISIPAGMNQMRLHKFVLLTMLGSGVWNSLLAVGGTVLGAQWEGILIIVEEIELFLVSGLFLVLVIRIVTNRKSLQKRLAAAFDGVRGFPSLK